MQPRDIITIGLLIVIAFLLFKRHPSNEEIWKWTDYKGFQYQIEVGRYVH